MKKSIGNYRWTICGLIFFATTINYLDRAVISLLKSTLTTEMHWDDGDYANVEIAFKLSVGLAIPNISPDLLLTAKSALTPV